MKSKEDEKPGLSVDDRAFLKTVNAQFCKDESGYWTCPLPFRESRPRLQKNISEVHRRARTQEKSLQRNPNKRKHFVEFMEKLFQNGHAEEAPPLTEDEECWYLPIFGVYHPRKPDQVRVVFDSAAKYHGLSLNDVLLSGPDLTNSLLGILLRFRREPVAVIADIQQMFYCFKVSEGHRNYLRFLWYSDNDLNKPLREYRMCVHVFGNTASPAVATYGLRKAASLSEEFDVTDFVHRDFYVDDGLASLCSVDKAVGLIQRTQQVLKEEGNLRLHKIASNRQEVMYAFPPEDLAKDIKDLDLGSDTLPIQRSLGVAWNLQSDSFQFQISMDPQPYTHRGLLSTVNSIFDPLGFVAPVTISGKLLLRKLIQGTTDWDAPLDPVYERHWESWKQSLADLHDLRIPRTYLPGSLSNCDDKSVHIFSDASELAIAAVGYLKTVDDNKETYLGFVLGKAKVAPLSGHSIPRLELCAAVLAVEIAESISNHLDLPIAEFKFYTDSKVVLGYINNNSRRFYTYVANRVQRIRSVTEPGQWSYVQTDKNPADCATRSISTKDMSNSLWLKGPSLQQCEISHAQTFKLEEPDSDKEVRPEITNLKTVTLEMPQMSLGSHRFSKFSSWKTLVEAIALLKYLAKQHCKANDNERRELFKPKTVQAFSLAEQHVVAVVQSENYSNELECLKKGKPCQSSSLVASLSPFLDDYGLIRVGGRLKHTDLTIHEKHPILVPGHHHIALLLVRHFHANVQHQGRHITAGAIRAAGFWITGAKRLISSALNKCVKCRRLRGNFSFQQMADLPSDRLEPGPPFTNVGVDCFGPWVVSSRRTRGGQANSKRWAVMFTCLTTRAIHIEILEELSSSSFINALKRFIAVRGPVKLFRSDRGTNFIGATSDLGVNAINVEDRKISEFLYTNGSTWMFNPPHASHHGGAWERLIGVTRRILDSLLMDIPSNGLTHEVLSTFMAEACAIMNSRPLVSVSTDPEDPMPLCPSMLLTQKTTEVGTPVVVNKKDMYKAQWKRVQLLADAFWNKWRSQYLQTLQGRRKWFTKQRNISCGDVVMLKDNQVCRNSWPLGIVTDTFPGNDNLVRSVKVRVVQQGRTTSFIRPVSELVLLLADESEQ